MTTSSIRPELVALEIADPPERWEALGFNVSRDRVIELGGVSLRLGGEGEGIVAWTLRGIDETSSIDAMDDSAWGSGRRAALLELYCSGRRSGNSGHDN